MMKKYWTFCVALNFAAMGLNLRQTVVSDNNGLALGALAVAALAGAVGLYCLHARDKS